MIQLQADTNTVFENSHVSMTLSTSKSNGGGDDTRDQSLCEPNVLRLLVVFNENRHPSFFRKNGFELRCGVQMKSPDQVHATCLEWRVWDNGTSQPDDNDLAQTVGQALDQQQQRVGPLDLVDWARPYLVPAAGSIGELQETQVDMGDGSMLTAQLHRPGPESIIGGVNHFIIEIIFDVPKF